MSARSRTAGEQRVTEKSGAHAERAASLDVVERAWFRLSVAERTILALHHLEHRPVTEIATVLRIPEGTAKSRLFQARRSLDRALEAERR